MDNVWTKRFRVLLAYGHGTSGLHLAVTAARDAAPENIVLTAGVYANDSPHLVIVGHDRHPWSPDYVENCQIICVVEFLNFRAFGLTQSFKNTSGIRDRAGDDFTDRFVGVVLSQSTAAVSDELVHV